MDTKTPCPPHHWRISRIEIDAWPYDHHSCARCGAEKDVPTGDSPSMYWDKSAAPERTAEIRQERQLIAQRYRKAA